MNSCFCVQMPLASRPRKKETPVNVPTDRGAPAAGRMGAACRPLTAPPSLPTVKIETKSPSYLQEILPEVEELPIVTPEPAPIVSPRLPDNVSGSESASDEDNPVKSSSDESEVSEVDYSKSVGPNSYIVGKMKQVDDLDECAAILKLVMARFKYLNLETCLCGKRLTKNYLESRMCKTCTLETNKKTLPKCGNCHLINLKGKWIEIGFCARCFGLLQKAELKIVKK